IVIKPGSHVFRRRLGFSTYKQAAFFGLGMFRPLLSHLKLLPLLRFFTYFLGIKIALLGYFLAGSAVFPLLGISHGTSGAGT
ncbi:hypothetical protein K438DRAFT_1873213, partial [Mycena galopus ATCC 62051]